LPKRSDRITRLTPEPTKASVFSAFLQTIKQPSPDNPYGMGKPHSKPFENGTMSPADIICRMNNVTQLNQYPPNVNKDLMLFIRAAAQLPWADTRQRWTGMIRLLIVSLGSNDEETYPFLLAQAFDGMLAEAIEQFFIPALLQYDEEWCPAALKVLQDFGPELTHDDMRVKLLSIVPYTEHGVKLFIFTHGPTLPNGVFAAIKQLQFRDHMAAVADWLENSVVQRLAAIEELPGGDWLAAQSNYSWENVWRHFYPPEPEEIPFS